MLRLLVSIQRPEFGLSYFRQLRSCLQKGWWLVAVVSGKVPRCPLLGQLHPWTPLQASSKTSSTKNCYLAKYLLARTNIEDNKHLHCKNLGIRSLVPISRIPVADIDDGSQRLGPSFLQIATISGDHGHYSPFFELASGYVYSHVPILWCATGSSCLTIPTFGLLINSVTGCNPQKM